MKKIDTIEKTCGKCRFLSEKEGYRPSYCIADDNCVVVDQACQLEDCRCEEYEKIIVDTIFALGIKPGENIEDKIESLKYTLETRDKEIERLNKKMEEIFVTSCMEVNKLQQKIERLAK